MMNELFFFFQNLQEEATASLMYEMEKDDYESINRTNIEPDVILDSSQNSPQPAKQSHVAKVLPNNQKYQNGKYLLTRD